MNLVLMSHHHHSTSLEGVAELLERLLDRRTIGIRRLLQLAQPERAIGAEEDRLEGR
jgi:hypothetical protein